MSRSDYPAGAFEDDNAPFNKGLKNRKPRRSYPRLNQFECSECKTKYSSPSKEPPPGIKWSDGHICTPTPITDEY